MQQGSLPSHMRCIVIQQRKKKREKPREGRKRAAKAKTIVKPDSQSRFVAVPFPQGNKRDFSVWYIAEQEIMIRCPFLDG